jgi:Tat protein translocase TatB subunit
MDFLGIGPLELIVILIITFIVVGPERLPEVARSIGKTLRDLRALSQGLTSEWQKEFDSLSQTKTGEGLEEILTKPFKEAQAELKQTLTAPLGLEETLTKPFKEAQTDLQQALSPAPASPSQATAEPTTLEPSPPEQSDTLDGDVNHADT